MSKKKTKAKQTIWALLFIAPFFVLFTVFTIYPIVQGVFVSLNKWTLMGRMKFVGLQNYQRLFRDHFFVDALWHTSFFVLLVVPLVVLLSL
ncbi:MAG: sugar ABC transporter permease, partial [Lachnospiraceae bacterium]|nr:sugar ABC transporter permease [Lachnospiraceae bacterium]